MFIGCDVGAGFHDPQFCQLSSSHRHLTTDDDGMMIFDGYNNRDGDEM